MSVTAQVKEDTTTISLDSKFDYDSIEEFREAYTNNPSKKYTIDFRNTEYMDSSGLGMLLNMQRHINDESIKIKLINCRTQIKKVLLISRFEQKFIIT